VHFPAQPRFWQIKQHGARLWIFYKYDPLLNVIVKSNLLWNLLPKLTWRIEGKVTRASWSGGKFFPPYGLAEWSSRLWGWRNVVFAAMHGAVSMWGLQSCTIQLACNDPTQSKATRSRLACFVCFSLLPKRMDKRSINALLTIEQHANKWSITSRHFQGRKEPSANPYGVKNFPPPHLAGMSRVTFPSIRQTSFGNRFQRGLLLTITFRRGSYL
jgi:hypothetical protein